MLDALKNLFRAHTDTTMPWSELFLHSGIPSVIFSLAKIGYTPVQKSRAFELLERLDPDSMKSVLGQISLLVNGPAGSVLGNSVHVIDESKTRNRITCFVSPIVWERGKLVLVQLDTQAYSTPILYVDPNDRRRIQYAGHLRGYSNVVLDVSGYRAAIDLARIHAPNLLVTAKEIDDLPNSIFIQHSGVQLFEVLRGAQPHLQVLYLDHQCGVPADNTLDTTLPTTDLVLEDLLKKVNRLRQFREDSMNA